MFESIVLNIFFELSDQQQHVCVHRVGWKSLLLSLVSKLRWHANASEDACPQLAYSKMKNKNRSEIH